MRLCALLLICLAPTWARAQTSHESAEKAAGLQFSRVYAPADRIADWPRGGVPYLPIKTVEFERLLHASQAAGAVEPSGAPRLERARYTAAVEGEELRGGTAQFDIVYAGDAPALLTLDPCELALSNPRWSGDKADTVSLGRGPDGKTVLLVAGSGRLMCDWSLRGRQDAEGLEFRLSLPACPTQQLQVDLPEGYSIHSDQGLSSIGPSDRGAQKATIDLGENSQVMLRVAHANEKSPASLSLLRQSMTYDFSTYGVNVSAQLKVDVHEQPLRQLALLVDAPLRPITARYGDQAIPWSLSTDAASGQSRWILDFSEQPIRGTNRLVQLGLLAPLPADGRSRLPGVRAEGLFWQGGSATLIVQSPLSLGRLLLSGCRQMNAAPLPAPLVGESIELQYFTPQPTIDLDVAPRAERLQYAAGSSVTLLDSEVKGQMVAEVRAVQGARFELEADVPRPWMIDAVESIPAGGVEDWTIEESNAAARKLTVRLTKGMQPQRSVRLVFTGRRRSSPVGEALSVDNLQMVDFRDAQATRRLLSVRAAGAYNLKITCTEEVTRLDPQRLDEGDAELVREPPGEIFFVVDAAAADWKVRLASRPPLFRADVAVQATVRGDVLTESYTFGCTPESNGLESAIVHFSQRRDEPPTWSLATEGEGALSARPLTVSEQRAAGFGEEGETWEIKFRRIKTAAFELRATRNSPLTKETSLALGSLAGTTGQQGTLLIRAAGDVPPKIHNERLAPVTAEAPPADEYTNLVGAYRYDPARDTQGAGAPISIGPGSPERPSVAWVWKCRLDSRCAPDGRAMHVATFYFENSGRTQIQMALPREAEVRSVWVNDDRATTTQDAAGSWLVDLPSGQRFPTITVRYTTTEGPLGLLSWLAPEPPTIDVPVLTRQTTLWLPPGYVGASRADWVGPTERLTWSQRLFGLLGAAAHARVFDPLSGEEWSKLASAQPNGSIAPSAVLDRFGAALVGLSRDPARRDWGQLLVQFDNELKRPNEPEEMALLIDAAALDRVGIAPKALIGIDGLELPNERGAALLFQAGLALVMEENSILLTTATEAALRAEPSSTQGVWIGPKAAGDTPPQSGNARFVSADIWRNHSPLLNEPWSGGPVDDMDGFSPGWTVYRLESNAAVTPSLRVVHHESMVALGWTLFLSVGAAAVWLGRGRVRRLLALAGCAGAAALMVPAAFAPPLTGMFLGILFALAWMSIVRTPMAGESCAERESLKPTGAQTPAELASTKTLITGALLLAVLISAGHAEEPAEPIYKVFVPIDDQRRLVGDTCYLPKPLYDALYRRAAAVEESAAWLIESSRYQGTLARDMTQGTVEVSDFKAAYQLRTLSAKTRVRIALPEAGVNLSPDAVRLDGAVIEPNWDKDGAALLVDVPEAGPHRLDLTLRLSRGEGGRADVIDLAIPAGPCSKLELTVPADVSEIEVPLALGAVTRDRAKQLLTAELGPASRLVVRCNETKAENVASFDVEELLWLRVQPGSTVLDAKFKCRVLAGKLQQLTLAADSRLRLLPPEDSSALQPRVAPGEPQSVIFDLPQPVSDEVTLEARFLLTGTSSVGNLRLPELQVTNAHSTSRALAVSVDPALEWQETVGSNATSMPVSEFLTAWGGSDLKPVAAHRMPQAETAWTLATQPREPTLTARQLISLDIRGGRAELADAITAITSDGYRYQYRIHLPEGVHIESVSVHEEESDRPARWSRDEAGVVTVFLGEAATGEQKVLIKGWLATAVRGPYPVPSITVEGAKPAGTRVLIFRRADALVKIRNVEGLESDVAVDSALALGEALQEGLLDQRAAERVRLVGVWQGTDPAASATVDVTSNAPFVSGVETITLSCDGDKWLADVECRLDVVAGQLDVLRFSAPAEFPGPYEVTPSATVEISNLPGRDQRHLIIRPHSAIEGQYRLHVRGPLVPAHDKVQVPDVLPLRIEPLTRYVVLPGQADEKQFAWETQGLRAARLPPNMAAPPGESLVYRAEGERLSAELKAVEHVASAPKVRLADVRVAWLSDDAYRGVASFDVDPAGASSCLLEMPAQTQLVSVSSAGLPVNSEGTGENRWSLPLGAPQLPQRVEVVFCGRLAGKRGQEIQLDAPRLVGMPVERTLWTVSSAPQGVELLGAEASDASHGELLRMQTTAGIVETAAESTSSTEPTAEEAHWYAPWARRMEVSRARFERQRLEQEANASTSLDRDLSSDDIAAAATAEREQLRAARRMGVALPTTTARVAQEPGELWAWTLGPDATTQVAQALGPADSLTLRVDARHLGDWSQRLFAALVLLSLCVAAVIGYRPGAATEFAWRWSHATVLLVGLAWWLWLSPSVVGMVIILAAIASLAAPERRWLPRWNRRLRPL